MRAVRSVITLLSVGALVSLTDCSRDAAGPGLGGTPSFAVVSGDGQSGIVGRPLANPLVIKATDSRGRVIKNLLVEFVVTSGGGSAAPQTARTNQNGLAQTSWTLGTSVALPQRLDARAVNSGALLGSFTATPLPDAPAQLTIHAGQGQSAVHQTSVPVPPAVRVTDQYGNVVSGVAVSFAVTSGGGSVAGGAATTGSDGVAAAGSWTLGQTLGENTLSATVSGTSPVTFTATAVVGPAATLTIHAGNNQTATVNTPVPIPPAVRVADQAGFPVAGVVVTFAPVQPSTVVHPTTVSSDENGIAAVSFWHLTLKAGTYALRATAAEVHDTVFFSATAVPGPVSASTSTVLATPTTITASSGSSVSSIQAIARDQFNNPISGLAVQFESSGNGNTLTQPASPTDGTGFASGTLRSTVAEQKVVSARVDGTLLSQTATVTVSSGPTATLAIVTGDGQTAFTTAQVATAPTVVSQDAFGNPTSGAWVRFTVFEGGGTSSATEVVTDANGLASVQWTLGPRPGMNAMWANLAAIGPLLTFHATAVTPAASLEIHAGDGQTATAGDSVPVRPTVIARDAAGQPTSHAYVEFLAGSGYGGPDAMARVTDSTGLASVGWFLGPYNGTNTLTARVAGTSLAVTFTATGTGSAWIRGADLPTPRVYHGVASVDDIVYAVGGLANDPYTTVVEAYNPASDSWSARAAMPTPRLGHGLAAEGGLLYAAGGTNGGGTLATLEVYDPATDTWTARAPMPTPRTRLALVAVNGRLYAIGGFGCVPPAPGEPCWWQSVGIVEIYDPATDSWSTGASMPTARGALGAAAVNGIVYAVGGQGNPTDPYSWLDALEAYDPVSDSWTTRSPMPTARFGLAVAARNGRVHAFGGDISFMEQVPWPGVHEAYDPVTDTWTAEALMPSVRSFFGAALAGGRLYLVGGNSASEVVEAYSPQ